MRASVLVSAVLIGAGLALFSYKVLVLGYPLGTGEQAGTWRVELVVNVTGQGGRTVIDVPLPRTSGYQRLLTEEVRSGPFRFSISEDSSERQGRWSGKLDGSATLSYQVTFDTRAYTRPLPSREGGGTYPKSVAEFLKDSPGIQVGDPAVSALSRELLLGGADKVKLARDIYAFVSHEIGTLKTTGAMDALTVIHEGRGNPLGRARLFCALARANGLPCRLVSGLILSNGRQDSLRHWNEVYIADGWVPFDVDERHAESLPPDRLVFLSTEAAPIRSTGASALSYRFDIQSELSTYSDLVRRRIAASPNLVDRVSLLFLPVQTQHNLRLLLLVPLGALAMCILRNVVGLQTFGTFMPMLIALAFTGVGPLWGTILLVIIIGFALLSRLWLERFYLLFAPRIAFILTLVVLLMVGLMLAGDRLGMPIAGVGAFPFVIMTMLVERISVSLEEEGMANTLRRISGTVLSIYLTYAVIHTRALQTIFLVFPELLVVILGLLILVGRYTGYRLTELIRFRAFTSPTPGGGREVPR